MVGFTIITPSLIDIWEFTDDVPELPKNTSGIPHDDLETDHPDGEGLVWAYELTEVL
jgi:hypothetical protein